MIVQNNLSLMDKLEILSDAAKYDVSCSSSGTQRKGEPGGLGNALKSGLCHCFAADGRCISLLKILYTNECIFDCKYCVNRSSRDVVRTSFTPQEVAELTIEFYRRNYIEGLFLSSGIVKSPNYTMEQLIHAISLLRYQYHFNGYIHVKAIPGASPDLVEMLGHLADRMSINLELPTSEGLKALAPHKNRKTILTPMKQIQLGIHENKYRSIETKRQSVLLPGEMQTVKDESTESMPLLPINMGTNVSPRRREKKNLFVPAGQSTQMIIGATKETDYEILHVVDSLYQKFELKRVYYSAFVNTTKDSSLPVLQGGPPLLREHRLYQADWLLRFYGFEASELLTKEKPNFNILLDPKCNWALNHLELFPLEVNKVSYSLLLRIPGIGPKSAKRIVQARKHTNLDFSDLKKLGVVMKRAIYFITCKGKMMYSVKMEEDYIIRHMFDIREKLSSDIGGNGLYQQISLFDDTNFSDVNGI